MMEFDDFWMEDAVRQEHEVQVVKGDLQTL